MKKVDIQTINLGDMLAQAIEKRFASPPVVAASPAIYQSTDIRQGRTLDCVVNSLRIRPPGFSQPRLKIVQDTLGNGQLEGFDLLAPCQRRAR